MPRYDSIAHEMRRVLRQDDSRDSIIDTFVKLTHGTTLDERIGYWNRLFEPGEPLEGEDLLNSGFGEAVSQPFAKERAAAQT